MHDEKLLQADFSVPYIFLFGFLNRLVIVCSVVTRLAPANSNAIVAHLKVYEHNGVLISMFSQINKRGSSHFIKYSPL